MLFGISGNNVANKGNPVNAKTINPVDNVYILAIMQYRLDSFEVVHPCHVCSSVGILLTNECINLRVDKVRNLGATICVEIIRNPLCRGIQTVESHRFHIMV